ncbi:alpha/beta hydrolase fold domain-containing protein [Paenibacillus alginolyticus]|uniref:Alpha/beta hydrolase n=2 Tax=Paenibacillus alginolyticus TaxID=59839 RepID=A0ABT4GAF5_9BACL|nr:alpha/beta hydrolase fold domain-containing protein [Paenibacillus alginolyticus]MCY9693161.1 alpha/beta hydrolase [Paenibacillus alginolyticus]
MGWDNADVTRSEIETKELQIEGTNGSIPLRIYTPSSLEGLLPVVVFFHGGGFIGGTVDVVENPCKALAEKAVAVVVNVDYRLAPEHPFPAGLTDCFETVEWVYKYAEKIRGDRSRIAVSGDSAGGNLETVYALMDRDRGSGMIKYQALIYPTVNMARVETDDFRWNVEEYAVKRHYNLIIPGLRRMAEGPNVLCEIYLQGNAKATDPRVGFNAIFECL